MSIGLKNQAVWYLSGFEYAVFWNGLFIEHLGCFLYLSFFSFFFTVTVHLFQFKSINFNLYNAKSHSQFLNQETKMPYKMPLLIILKKETNLLLHFSTQPKDGAASTVVAHQHSIIVLNSALFFRFLRWENSAPNKLGQRGKVCLKQRPLGSTWTERCTASLRIKDGCRGRRATLLVTLRRLQWLYDSLEDSSRLHRSRCMAGRFYTLHLPW